MAMKGLMFPSLFAVAMKGVCVCRGGEGGHGHVVWYYLLSPKQNKSGVLGHVCVGSKSTNKHHLKMELGCYGKTRGFSSFCRKTGY